MSHVIIRLGEPDLPPANKIARHSVIPALSHSLQLLLAGKIALQLATYWQDKRKQLIGFMKKKNAGGCLKMEIHSSFLFPPWETEGRTF